MSYQGFKSELALRERITSDMNLWMEMKYSGDGEVSPKEAVFDFIEGGLFFEDDDYDSPSATFAINVELDIPALTTKEEPLLLRFHLFDGDELPERNAKIVYKFQRTNDDVDDNFGDTVYIEHVVPFWSDAS